MTKQVSTRAAADGSSRKLGAKGRRTRQQLIDATVTLLQTHGLRDVSVVDVARLAQTSPATFYVYFKGVPEAVLAALDNVGTTFPKLEVLARRDWSGPDALGAAHAFVEQYTEFWNRHRTIFLVRNLASEEGDARFYAARTTQAAPFMAALRRQIIRAQAAGRIPQALSPSACAGTTLMMLERLSAIGPVERGENDRITYAELKAAAAYSIAVMLGATETILPG